MSRKTNEEISNIIFQDNICCCLPPPSFALTTNEKRQSPCFLFRFNDPIYFLVIFFYVKMKYKFSKQIVPSTPRKDASHTVSISDLNDLIHLWNWFIFTKFYAQIVVMVFKTGMPEVNIVNSVKQCTLSLSSHKEKLRMFLVNLLTILSYSLGHRKKNVRGHIGISLWYSHSSVIWN